MYANCVGLSKQKVDRKAVLRNLRELGIAEKSTAYGRDADRATALKRVGGAYHILGEDAQTLGRQVVRELLCLSGDDEQG